MLIQFSFKNFKSFKDETTLDMTASSIKEHLDKVIEKDDNKYLKVTAVYGANASGKSNVIEAFSHMKRIILDSFTEEAKWKNIPLKRFNFDEESKNSTSMFEVFFKYNNETYQYGFELDNQSIKEEWLYKEKKIKYKKFELVFARENNEFELSKELKIYSEMLNGLSEKTLILSFLANIKIE
ncbi:MAG: AAA family ATPase, partial [Fusobacterium sp.]